ncbi:MAG: hypothetical protein JO256_00010 [Alphaproteobacteria bacterium]|nr:hypothetical protein [Alphaproteobacteria bacterium]
MDSSKWTARRLTMLSIYLILMIFFGWKIHDDILIDQESWMEFASLSIILAIPIAAIFSGLFRRIILEQARFIVIVGCLILVFAISLLAFVVFYALHFHEIPAWLNKEYSAVIFSFLFCIGGLLAILPMVVRRLQSRIQHVQNTQKSFDS